MRRSSSVVIGSNSDRRDVDVRVLSTGAVSLAVAARIKFTFRLKKVAKSSAEMLTDDPGDGGVSNELMFVHMDLKSPLHADIAVDQNLEDFLL